MSPPPTKAQPAPVNTGTRTSVSASASATPASSAASFGMSGAFSVSGRLMVISAIAPRGS
jgi:hypothetical protein